ncbi:MAG: MBL fold metallo-hydrolase [Clostridia bacterium]|nr:MBL fold metallo-hydrolase [Clostridia bacterium]MBQ8511469.1 MBL fold metallo-hydrolase [Clostridia bacterium]
MAKRKRKKKPEIRVTPAGIAGTVLVLLFLTVYCVWAYQLTGTVFPTMELIDGRANFRFVNVGQGDCTLVTHHGDGILIDAGTESAGKRAAEYVRMYSPTVDYFIVTHPHEDHMGGAAEVLRTVKVECLVLPTDTSDEEFYREALMTAELLGVEILYVTEDITLTTEHLTAEIVDMSGVVSDDMNDRSLITKITADGCTLLATGDAEAPAENDLLTHHADILDADLLKVGHHGSSSSSGAEFLAAVSPDTAVISCGRNNTYGHPAYEVTERMKEMGITIRRTDYDGTVVLRTGMTLEEWVKSLAGSLKIGK